MRPQLFGHDVDLASEHEWDTLTNGVLLDRAEEAGYEVLITTDQGIRHQQNMSNRRIAVLVLMNTAWPRISQRAEDIRNALGGMQPGEVREVPIPMRDEAQRTEARPAVRLTGTPR